MRQSFAGSKIIGEDIFQDALGDDLYEIRSRQVFEHTDELIEKVRTKINGTPLEGISDGAIESLLIFHPLEAVEASVQNYILPDAEQVWSILVKAFEDIYLDKKLGKLVDEIGPGAYFTVLQQGKKLVA
jgi:hypothetical protein